MAGCNYHNKTGKSLHHTWCSLVYPYLYIFCALLLCKMKIHVQRLSAVCTGLKVMCPYLHTLPLHHD